MSSSVLLGLTVQQVEGQSLQTRGAQIASAYDDDTDGGAFSGNTACRSKYSPYLTKLYPQYAPFVLAEEELSYVNAAVLGANISIPISSDVGHLLTHITLELTWTAPLIGFHRIGHQCIDHANLVIGNVLMERLTGEALYVKLDVCGTEIERQVYEDLLLSGGPGSRTCVVPLRFKFSDSWQTALRLFALAKYSIEIQIYFRPYVQIDICPIIGRQPVPPEPLPALVLNPTYHGYLGGPPVTQAHPDVRPGGRSFAPSTLRLLPSSFSMTTSTYITSVVAMRSLVYPGTYTLRSVPTLPSQLWYRLKIVDLDGIELPDTSLLAEQLALPEHFGDIRLTILPDGRYWLHRSASLYVANEIADYLALPVPTMRGTLVLETCFGEHLLLYPMQPIDIESCRVFATVANLSESERAALMTTTDAGSKVVTVPVVCISHVIAEPSASMNKYVPPKRHLRDVVLAIETEQDQESVGGVGTYVLGPSASLTQLADRFVLLPRMYDRRLGAKWSLSHVEFTQNGNVYPNMMQPSSTIVKAIEAPRSALESRLCDEHGYVLFSFSVCPDQLAYPSGEWDTSVVTSGTSSTATSTVVTSVARTTVPIPTTYVRTPTPSAVFKLTPQNGSSLNNCRTHMFLFHYRFIHYYPETGTAEIAESEDV
jgi:hypothetical protein